MSEIDDIFASKSKTVPSPSTSVSLLKTKKKAKKAKLASAHDDPPHASSSAITPASKKRPPPETVVDTSANVPSLKRQKKETGPGKGRVRQSTKSTLSEPNGGLFKDSRGSGARTLWSHIFRVYLMLLLKAERRTRAGQYTKKMNWAYVTMAVVSKHLFPMRFIHISVGIRNTALPL